jgi:hypothetical protein
MENAMWLASISGPFMTILGLWMLFCTHNLKRTWASIKSSEVAIYFSGVLNLLLGLIILSLYNVWSFNPEVLVTLLGWVVVVRGVLRLFAPEFVIRLTVENYNSLTLMKVALLAWGIALCWVAYIM